MNNITPLTAPSEWKSEAAPRRSRGKSSPNYASKATVRRLVDAVRSSGIEPRCVTFLPGGGVQLSELAQPSAGASDEFSRWESRL